MPDPLDARSWTLGVLATNIFLIERGARPAACIKAEPDMIEEVRAATIGRVSKIERKLKSGSVEFYLFKYPVTGDVIKELLGAIRYNAWAWGQIFGYDERSIECQMLKERRERAETES